MLKSAKFFPITDQIFGFDIFKWPKSREINKCGIREKFFNFYHQNFKCFFDLKEKDNKTWYTFSETYSYLFIILLLFLCVFIHWLLYKMGFYNNRTKPNGQTIVTTVTQSPSSNSIEQKETVMSSGNVQDLSPLIDHNMGSMASTDHSKKSQNLKEDEVLLTKITEKKYGYLISPQSKSQKGPLIDRTPYVVNVSETNIETSTINKNEIEKKLSLTDSNKTNKPMPSAIEGKPN